MSLARILGGVGRLLIWSGAIILAFVAYQLWGTGIEEARAQNSLEDEFDDLLALQGASTAVTTTAQAPPPEPSTTVSTTTTTTTSTIPAPPPPPDDGEAVARIVIPRIGVDKIVVEGVGRSDLQKGPGHYPGTPLPGQSGNAAIAGHRTTYGAPFNRVDELESGDEILVTTLQGVFRYEVIEYEIVSPTRVDVIEDHGDDRLTLTSCHPKYSARERYIVSAVLVNEPAPAPTTVPEPVEELPSEETPDAGTDDPDDAADVEAPEDDDTELAAAAYDSLDGGAERTAGPAVVWGLVTFVIWLAFAILATRWRRIPSYLLGAPVFGLSLFVFFGAVSELLPANF